jgi:hypothetical protein
VARELLLKCDVCGKATEQIVAKLTFIPMIPGVTRSAHSNYSHHADVGSCCREKVLKAIHFRKRTTVEEYQRSRRKGTKVA